MFLFNCLVGSALAYYGHYHEKYGPLGALSLPTFDPLCQIEGLDYDWQVTNSVVACSNDCKERNVACQAACNVAFDAACMYDCLEDVYAPCVRACPCRRHRDLSISYKTTRVLHFVQEAELDASQFTKYYDQRADYYNATVGHLSENLAPANENATQIFIGCGETDSTELRIGAVVPIMDFLDQKKYNRFDRGTRVKDFYYYYSNFRFEQLGFSANPKIYLWPFYEHYDSRVVQGDYRAYPEKLDDTRLSVLTKSETGTLFRCGKYNRNNAIAFEENYRLVMYYTTEPYFNLHD